MNQDGGIDKDEMQEIIEDFLNEANDLTATLDSLLIRLETEPGNFELLNEIFRAAHTIKGTSGFLGYDQVMNLTHKMEDVLNKLRKAELQVTPAVMDSLLRSVDLLKDLITAISNKSGEEFDLTDILSQLEAHTGKTGRVEFELTPKTVPVLKEDMAVAGVGKGKASASDSLRFRLAESETVTIAKEAPAPRPENVKSDLPRVAARVAPEQTIRVEVERLDHLINMMGELVLGRNSLLQTVNRLTEEKGQDNSLDELQPAVNAVNFITTELQTAVMKIRMQPIERVFRKMPRLVRDLARDTGKQISIEILGESTELDKSVIEEINDPLVHVLRNACDHGIEPPEERRQKGKPPVGKITLSARQEGSNIVVEVADDGRGLDAEAIRRKAIEKGIISANEAEQLSETDVFRLIFKAGLSTAKQVTGISGRGVGMDVVRNNIQRLSGLIELASVPGEGTVMTIKLPLTLAIINGLMVECDDEVFVLPMASVFETVKASESELYYINKRPVLRLRDDIIPVVNLGKILRGKLEAFVLAEKPYIVIVGLGEKKLGLMIDRFLGQEEVVIKSLGQFLRNTEGIAGATILGDGRIRLIVDLIGLFNIAKKIV